MFKKIKPFLPYIRNVLAVSVLVVAIFFGKEYVGEFWESMFIWILIGFLILWGAVFGVMHKKDKDRFPLFLARPLRVLVLVIFLSAVILFVFIQIVDPVEDLWSFRSMFISLNLVLMFPVIWLIGPFLIGCIVAMFVRFVSKGFLGDEKKDWRGLGIILAIIGLFVFWIWSLNNDIKAVERFDRDTENAEKRAWGEIYLKNKWKKFVDNENGFEFEYPPYCEKKDDSISERYVLSCSKKGNEFDIVVISYNSMIPCKAKYCCAEIQKRAINETEIPRNKLMSKWNGFISPHDVSGLLGRVVNTINEKEWYIIRGVYFDCNDADSCAIELVFNSDDEDNDRIYAKILSSLKETKVINVYE
ncbi:hypothetical protein ACFL08_05420 [Patescibacteria group bacterium]